MFNKVRERISALKKRNIKIPRGYIVIPLVLLISSLVIRVSSGGTYLVYNALGTRGIFPGPMTYTFFYFVRLIICSELLTYTLYCMNVLRDKSAKLIVILGANLLLLLEYKLIFGGLSIILCIMTSALAAVLVMITIKNQRYRNKAVSVSSVVLIILQIVLIIQLISLSFCI